MAIHENLDRFIADLHFALSIFEKERTEKAEPDLQNAEDRLITTLREAPDRISKERDRLEKTNPTPPFIHTDSTLPSHICTNSYQN